MPTKPTTVLAQKFHVAEQNIYYYLKQKELLLMTEIQPKKHSVGPSKRISIPLTKQPLLHLSPRQFSLVGFSGYIIFFKVVYIVICYICFSLGLISVTYIFSKLNFFFP
jgi:hypothetical protein